VCKVERGGLCETSAQCERGFACRDGSCIQLGKVGERCPCEPGLICDTDRNVCVEPSDCYSSDSCSSYYTRDSHSSDSCDPCKKKKKHKKKKRRRHHSRSKSRSHSSSYCLTTVTCTDQTSDHTCNQTSDKTSDMTTCSNYDSDSYDLRSRYYGD
jgi:hypothetical protein